MWKSGIHHRGISCPYFILRWRSSDVIRLTPRANQDLIDDSKLGRLDLEASERIRQRLKERFAQVPGERKPVDEMVAERTGRKL
jgi:hypothetical protein